MRMDYALQSRATNEFMATQVKIFGFFTFLFLNSVVTQAVPRLSSQAEWRALLDLRSSLGISAKDWHKKANPCSNWTGIECRKGHIIGINLSDLRRSVAGKRNPRFSVDSLPNFPLLTAFNSSGFILRGSIPEWFGERLKNLEVVDLSSSSISGSIPSSIGSLSRLTCLCLSNNSITGNIPTTLEKLVSLSILNLSHNSLTGHIPVEISSLVNLTKLDLSNNFFSGLIPSQFGYLSGLNLLNLRNNSLSSSIPSEIGNLSELALLDLGSNSIFGSLPRELGGLTSLKKMLVGDNKLEGSLLDGLFQNLTQLEELDLSRNSFVEEFPDVLWSMPHLKHLDVSVNNLTGVFPSGSAFSTVNAAVFNFSSNLFYGNLSSGFGNIGVLDLSSNYFEGYSPSNGTGKTIFLSNNCLSSVEYPRDLDECRMFYADRGVPFGSAEISEPPTEQPIRSRKRLAYLMIGVFGGLGFLIVVAGMLFLLKQCSITSTRQSQNVGSVGDFPPPKAFVGLGESFTYEQMLVATSNFSSENLIKQGHSGDLFKGSLEGGAPVVVKRVDLRFIRKESFMSELELWSKMMHPRLVPLVGHCLEDESEKFLVYKYMPNGDLSSSLYRVSEVEEGLQSLDWITRLKIAIGAAEALSYLHHECSPPLVHRDIQASSILLDDKYEVRLGSLSEVCVQGSNNHQNMVAKLLRTPQTSGKRPSGSSTTTCAYDVYNFGKVLLELVTGKFGMISRLNDTDANQWLDYYLPLISIYEKEMMIKAIDQSLMIDEDLVEEVWAVAVVAKSCLNHKASRRPSMRQVLKALENPFKVVRDENFGSGRMRTASWTAAFFGSWHRSSSDGSNMSSQTNGGIRHTERVGSRGSGANDHSSSHKRSSSDVFPEPEPAEMQDGSR